MMIVRDITFTVTGLAILSIPVFVFQRLQNISQLYDVIFGILVVAFFSTVIPFGVLVITETLEAHLTGEISAIESIIVQKLGSLGSKIEGLTTAASKLLALPTNVPFRRVSHQRRSLLDDASQEIIASMSTLISKALATRQITQIVIICAALSILIGRILLLYGFYSTLKRGTNGSFLCCVMIFGTEFGVSFFNSPLATLCTSLCSNLVLLYWTYILTQYARRDHSTGIKQAFVRHAFFIALIATAAIWPILDYNLASGGVVPYHICWKVSNAGTLMVLSATWRIFVLGKEQKTIQSIDHSSSNQKHASPASI